MEEKPKSKTKYIVIAIVSVLCCCVTICSSVAAYLFYTGFQAAGKIDNLIQDLCRDYVRNDGLTQSDFEKYFAEGEYYDSVAEAEEAIYPYFNGIKSTSSCDEIVNSLSSGGVSAEVLPEESRYELLGARVNNRSMDIEIIDQRDGQGMQILKIN